MKEWIQFSVWDDRWPHRAITDFLPAIRELIGPETRWHFLYEPFLLVRINVDSKRLYWDACSLAEVLGYDIEEGDVSQTTPGGQNGLWYYGEAEHYGSEELWQANANCLWATSELMIRLEQEGKLNFKMLRKHTHLFANAAGKNYIQSVWFWLQCAVQDFKLFLRYGFD